MPSTGFLLKYRPHPTPFVWANTNIGYVFSIVVSPRNTQAVSHLSPKHWLGGSPHPQWAASSPPSKLSVRCPCSASLSMGSLCAVLPYSTHPIATFCRKSHRPSPAAGAGCSASIPQRINGGTRLMSLNVWLRFQRHAGMGAPWATSVFPVPSTATGLS